MEWNASSRQGKQARQARFPLSPLLPQEQTRQETFACAWRIRPRDRGSAGIGTKARRRRCQRSGTHACKQDRLPGLHAGPKKKNRETALYLYPYQQAFALSGNKFGGGARFAHPFLLPGSRACACGASSARTLRVRKKALHVFSAPRFFCTRFSGLRLRRALGANTSCSQKSAPRFFCPGKTCKQLALNLENRA